MPVRLTGLDVAVRHDCRVEQPAIRIQPLQQLTAGTPPDGYAAALERVTGAPWFRALGDWREPVAGPLLLSSDEDWPGPEDPRCEAYSGLAQEHFDVVTADNAGARQVFKQIETITRENAAARSEGYDPDEDPWYAPTARVWEAAVCAALFAGYVARGEGVHPDVWEMWLWFESGHWPCGFAVVAPGLQNLMIM
jgi:hypothetical protein